MTFESPSPAPTVTINQDALLALANQRYGKGVDADMRGKSITDYDVLLRGAYGPAVMRLVNLAVTRSPDAAIPVEELPALASEAFSQVTDIDFAGNVISDYRILFIQDYGFGSHVLRLLELAREHKPICACANESLLSSPLQEGRT